MRVEDVMSRNVLTIGPETPLKAVAQLLVQQGISGLPVVDTEGRVLGVVSETDILHKEREPQSGRGWLRWFRRPTEAESKVDARTAGDAMTSPPVTAHPTMPVSEAATLMLERGVDRLVVVKGWSFGEGAEDVALEGIVTRGDCVRAFARPDEEIDHEVQDIAERQYGLPPHRIHVTVESGDITLEGEVDVRLEAESLAAAVARVPGVVSVTNNLTWRLDEVGLPSHDASVRY
jgi:CBS domain-containing protein